MRIKAHAYLALLLAPAMAFGVVIVDDNFADGDRAATGPLQSSWWGSSTGSAIESNVGSIGLVSGSSGRQIHTLFATQTLSNPGDKLIATIDFTTPATVGTAGEDLKFGLFDNLGRTSGAELGQDTSYSSSSPNPLYNGLYGFYSELDVESADPATDLNMRRSDPSTSGRLLSTSGGFTSLGSGPDIGYAITSNTSYNVVLTVERNLAGELLYTTDFLGNSYTVTDATPGSYDFGMLGAGASSGAFGSSNTPGDPDNGIDITNFKLEVIPEPATIALFGISGIALMFARRFRF